MLDAFDVESAVALFTGYHFHWGSSPYVTIANEQQFRGPIRNPQTIGVSQTFEAAGKRDAIVRMPDGRLAFRETKTVGEAIDDERYWRRLMVDPQITMYYLYATEDGSGVETILFDVIRKPTIAPYRATPLDKRKYKKDGSGLYANMRETDETPAEWGARLLADIRERPHYYYARREIPRLQKDVEEFRVEIWDVAKDIRDAQLKNKWYRNPGRHCDLCCYQGPCYGFIAFEPGMVPEGFIQLTTPHPELEDHNGHNRDGAPVETAACV